MAIDINKFKEDLIGNKEYVNQNFIGINSNDDNTLIPTNFESINNINNQEENVTSTNPSNGEDSKLLDPLNYTDPIVFHDPVLPAPSIVTKLSINQSQPNVHTTSEEPDMNKMEGREFPLILLNTTLLKYTQIEKMTIYYDEFLPRIYLRVKDDTNGTLKFSNKPGLNNHIYVILVPEVDGKYKNISLNFYIDNCDFTKGDSYVFTGHLWVQSLEETQTCQIKYVGCSNTKEIKGESSSTKVSCNAQKQPLPNTWEYLHEIAKVTGLGFASTNNCQDIQDRLPRLVQHSNFKDFIEKQIKISGLDENSIFDVWVDLYRYLVMVNVNYVLNENIDVNHLAINAIVGKNAHIENSPESKYQLVHRTLTSSSALNISNMGFDNDNFTQISDNDIHTSGMLVNVPFFKLKGGLSGSNNDISTKDIQSQESSVDGKKISQYNTSNQVPISFCVDPYNTNYQKVIREKYLELKRSKKFKLVLNRINFGLQRGTLINVLQVVTNPVQKRKALTNKQNLNEENDNYKQKNLAESEKNIVEDESIEVIDKAVSGLYYIDGMTFEFDFINEKIIQNLFLIKKDDLASYNNINTPSKVDEKELEEPKQENSNKENNNSTTNEETDNNEDFSFEGEQLVKVNDYTQIYINTNGGDKSSSNTTNKWYSKFFD